MSSIRKLRRAKKKIQKPGNPELNLAKIELMPGNMVTFVHDFPAGNFGPGDSFQTAFESWNMDTITTESFIAHVKKKNPHRVCMTEETFLRRQKK